MLQYNTIIILSLKLEPQITNMDLFTDIKSGYQFCMKMGNPCADHILKQGIFEYDVIKWCEQFVSMNGNFIDIGAHMGTYSVILSKKCRHVFAFEAQKFTADCLSIGLAINSCLNVTVHNVALGSEKGTGTLHHVSEDGGGSTVRSTIPTMASQKVLSTEEISINTLDSYEIDNVDFLKLDVEGFELEVLKGATETLKRSRYPPFVFEAWNDDWYKQDKEALFAFVRQLGYKIHPIRGTSNMYLAADHPIRTEIKDSAVDRTQFDLVAGVKSESEAKVETPTPIESDMNLIVGMYEAGFLKDQDFITWETWYSLAKHYRFRGNNQRAYDCAMKGLELNPPKNKEYLLYEEISIVAFYIKKIEEGYQACEKVVLSHHSPWHTQNSTLHNEQYYMKKLPFKKVNPIDYVLPEHYIGSSSAIIPHREGYLFNMRSVNYSITSTGAYDIRDPDQIVRTRNFLLSMDKDLNVTNGVELLDTSGVPLYPKNIRGLEDIRLINANEFFCTYLEVNDQRIPQMCYCQYDCTTGNVTKIIPLSMDSELKCEKNWIPVVIDSELWFIHTVSPLKLYKLDRENGKIQLVKEITITDPDKNLTSFRGSGGLIEYKGGWLGTIHQVYHNNPRKYFHRFVWFDRNFNFMKYSRVFYFESPNIEYTVALCHSPDGLLMPYSIKDNCSKLGVIDYEVLHSLFEDGLDDKVSDPAVFVQVDYHKALDDNTGTIKPMTDKVSEYAAVLVNSKTETIFYDQDHHDRLLTTMSTSKPSEPRSGLRIAILGYTSAAVGYWDPSNTADGLPGSEECAVYASQELANRGHSVALYMNPPSNSVWSLPTSNPRWYPEYMWNDHSNPEMYDLVIMWRRFDVTTGRKRGKMVFFWPHDDPGPSQHRFPFPDFDGVFALTDYHWKRLCVYAGYGKIPATICGNGIVPEQFAEPMQITNPYSIGYFSNYSRGLAVLLLLWPEIRKEFPTATLSICYGRQTWSTISDHGLKLIVDKIHEYKDMGVTEYGKIGHQPLADLMCQTSVWAYPCTALAETFCITASKCQAAGCIPVTTRIAALNETVHPEAPNIPLIVSPIDILKYQDVLMTTLRRIRDSSHEAILAERKKYIEFGNRFSWKACVDKWLNLYESIKN